MTYTLKLFGITILSLQITPDYVLEEEVEDDAPVMEGGSAHNFSFAGEVEDDAHAGFGFGVVR